MGNLAKGGDSADAARGGVREPPVQPAPGEPAVPSRRRWRNRLIALLGGFGVLVLAELVLSAAGYGGSQRLFNVVQGVGGEADYVTNPVAFRHIFLSNPIILRTGASWPHHPPQRFTVAKPPETFRVMVLGGSAVLGWPYPANGSFPSFLQTMLSHTWEGGQPEVVNLGVTAISSYTVRERVTEALGYGADLVVVYTGHNEFFGAYGAASTISLSRRRSLALAQIWLRRRRLTMLMGGLIAALSPEPSPIKKPQALGQILPRRTDIRLGDALYEQAKANYRANIEDIVRQCRRAGVPLVLCTLGANLRDFPPLGSMLPEGISESDRQQWEQRCRAAERLLEADDAEGAARERTQAAALAPGHAETHYRLARALERLGRTAEAAEQYRAARDYDTVRWRISGDFNEVVRDIARTEGAALADVEAHLVRRARGPVPGAEMFLEHVHPNLRGAYEAALAIEEAARPLVPVRPDRHMLPTFEDCLAAQQVSLQDRRYAVKDAIALYRDALHGGHGSEAQIEALEAELASLERQLPALEAASVKRAGRFIGDRKDLLHAWEWVLWAQAEAYDEAGQPAEALARLRKIRRYGAWQIENERLAQVFGAEAALHLRMENVNQAKQAARYALDLDPEHPLARRVLARAAALPERAVPSGPPALSPPGSPAPGPARGGVRRL